VRLSIDSSSSSSSNSNSNSDNKKQDKNDAALQKIINISWISVPVGLVVSLIGYFVFLWLVSRNEEMDTNTIPMFAQALKLYGMTYTLQLLFVLFVYYYCIINIFFTKIVCFFSCCIVVSTWLELLAEPMFIVTQNMLLYHVRLRIEGIGLLAKVFVNILLVAIVKTHVEQVRI